MRAYRALFVMSAREAFAQKGSIIGTACVHLFHIVALLGIYSVAFNARGGSLAGMDMTSTLWSIRAYFIVLALSVRLVAKEMAKEIRHGSFETKLNKPFNYFVASWATQLGRGMPYFILVGAFNVAFLFIVLGPPALQFSLIWAAGALALFLGGICLGLLFYGIIGLCAVWLQDVDPLYWVMDKGVMLLGGAYIPVALFPSSIRALGEHTPFGAIMFISHIFNPDFSARWGELFLTQVIWMLIFFIVAVFVYKNAMKHVSVNGG